MERWLTAVDDENAAELEALTSEEVETVGPRGRGTLERCVPGEWLARSGFRSRPLRWFCGRDGRVVVEMDGQWHDVATGERQGQRVIGSEFVVRDGRITCYVRHDSGLSEALLAAGLDERCDSVTARS